MKIMNKWLDRLNKIDWGMPPVVDVKIYVQCPSPSDIKIDLT